MNKIYGNFTHQKSINNPYVDVHHLMEKRVAKRYGLDPFFYYNQIEVEHWYHINKLSIENTSQSSYEALENLLHHILEILDIGFPSPVNRGDVLFFYRWVTIEKCNKNYFLNHNTFIIDGYNFLKEESEKLK